MIVGSWMNCEFFVFVNSQNFDFIKEMFVVCVVVQWVEWNLAPFVVVWVGSFFIGLMIGVCVRKNKFYMTCDVFAKLGSYKNFAVFFFQAEKNLLTFLKFFLG